MKIKKMLLTMVIPFAGITLMSIDASAKTYTDMYTNYRRQFGEYEEYRNVNTYMEHPLDSSKIFGTIVEQGSSTLTKECISHEYGPYGANKDKIHLPVYAYTYTELATINFPYKTYEELDLLESDFVEKKLSRYESTTVTEALSLNLGAKIANKLTLGDGSFSASGGRDLSANIGAKIEKSNTIGFQEETLVHYNAKGKGLHKLQRRLTCKVCALSIYIIEYFPNVVDESKWYTKDVHYDYINGKKLYMYMGTEYIYELDTNRNGLYLYEYDSSKKEYVYAYERDKDVIYL